MTAIQAGGDGTSCPSLLRTRKNVSSDAPGCVSLLVGKLNITNLVWPDWGRYPRLLCTDYQRTLELSQHRPAIHVSTPSA